MRATIPCSCHVLLGLLLALPASWAAAADAAPTVRIADGTLSGIHLESQAAMALMTAANSGKSADWGAIDTAGLYEFRGIPYAAPPVGALRWKPPQPVAAWQGVRAADRFGPRCMQRPLYGDMVFRSNGMSEDCLYLNVWTRSPDRHARLPVLVYFYGGSMLAGDGSEPRYDGASLARRGIVTVTVNYRLDVFGLLALPALAAESPQHAAGNYSLLDMTAALHWVRANIAA
ncbi:MAG TPA: carboxylesterase family protein, partial [Rhodanobacter sp.]